MPPKQSVAASLAPSSNSPSPYGRRVRGPQKEQIPDGRSLREATRQIHEDRQQAGFNKQFAKSNPNIQQLLEHLRKDHDPKDVTTVVVAIRHMLQQIKKSPKYTLHRFHRLLAAVSVIRKAYFESRMRFVIKLVTLCERWTNLERNAPRQNGPISRTALAAALDEKYDLSSTRQTDVLTSFRGNEKWQSHMCPLMIKRAVLLAQYRRMRDEFLKRWHLYKLRSKPRAHQPRKAGSVVMELGGVRRAFVPIDSVFKDENEAIAADKKKFGEDKDSKTARPENNTTVLISEPSFSLSRNDPNNASMSHISRPSFASRTNPIKRDPNEPRFPWYAILHSLNLQQLIDLTLRTHKHEERLSRLAAAEAEAMSSGVANIALDAHSKSFDPRRMSTVSSQPKTESESFDSDVLTNAVDEYCAGIDRDWVAWGYEMEARISSQNKGGVRRGGSANNKNRSPSRSPSPAASRQRKPVSSLARSLQGLHSKRSATPNPNINMSNATTINNTSIINNISTTTTTTTTISASTPQPTRSSAAVRQRLPPLPSSSSTSNNKSTAAALDDDDDSSDDSDDDGRRNFHGKKVNESGLSATAEGRKKRRNQELTAQQKMEEMKGMTVLSKFFNWGERPRVNVPVRIAVSTKYHEKLLKSRASEIEKGKSVGQGVVTDHLCLHQLEQFREMDHMTRSMFMRGVRKPLPSTVDPKDTKQRKNVMSRASKELATAQGLDQIIAIVQPPPMKFAM